MKNKLIMQIKKIFKNQFLRKKISTFMYNFRIIFKKKNLIEKNIYDYKKIIKNEKFFCHEIFRPNFFYGISNTLRDFSNYNKKIEACIEHGVYFGNYINENESIDSGLPAVITFGEMRKSILRQNGCKKIIVEIGPYIYYANQLLTDKEIIYEKKKNGKTLLVFPSHSIDNSTTNFDIKEFINSIEKIKKDNNFKTVIICLYYRDIELGREKIYLDMGYKVTTAGRRENKDFLSRQKTLILLSDYTLSNSVGTHVGYSIALKKPHTILKQHIDYNVKDKDGEKQIVNTKLKSSLIQKNEVYTAFSKYNEKITKEQINICNFYWGLDKIKTSHELNTILSFCKTVAKKSRHKESNFNGISHKELKKLERSSQKLILESLFGSEDETK